MTHTDDERPEEETQEAGAPEEKPQAEPTAPAGEDEEQDPAVAEIEQDPSQNPPNDLLRDIKGG